MSWENGACQSCHVPTLAERLGIEQAADQLIYLGERPGAAHPGRKLLTLVHSMLARGDCIDDTDLLRCGATSQVLGHQVMAPSTIGTFLRAFTFGHVRQLDQQAFSALRASVRARAYYDALRARGVGHQAALRQLANRLVGILHGCLRIHTCYDKATAWPQHAQAEVAVA